MTTLSPDGAPSVQPTGTIDAALAHAARLVPTAPELAIEQAQEILIAVPGHPIAQLLLGMAQRWAGQGDAALKTLEPLAAAQPRAAAVQSEYGMALADAGDPEAALRALRNAVALNPDLTDAWRAIGDLSMLLADKRGADIAYAAQIKASTKDPQLLAAAAALFRNEIPEAEALLRQHLRLHATDVAALRMLAEVAGRLGRYQDAQALLRHCIDLAPSFNAAHHDLAIVLNRQNRHAEALEAIEHLLNLEPRNPGYRNLRAMVLAKIGEHRESIEIYAEILRTHANQSGIWMNYGHALSAAGRAAECAEAYRRCIALEPQCGEAYWSLANLKTLVFSPNEISQIKAQLERTDLSMDQRLHFEFALGKAMEDRREYADAFEHYLEGNRLRRQTIRYDADETHDHVRRCKSLFTREFFESRQGYGDPAPDPIFIVGLPRAGSTLIEQILASHSGVEGTMELTDIMSMAKRLGVQGKKTQGVDYPEILANLGPAECRELGALYIEQTRIQRKTGKPLFIDKMPNNFLHIGLIRLALPSAKIIDARRHPMACCFSGFKQHFARGQHFTYSLEEIGRYYRDYVELMRHFDEVLPGRIHRVIYEDLVADTVGGVERLLAYCGLEFEDSCLRFYENERAVRTASAQQVRKPIYREGVDHWQHFEPWLGPLRQALGSVLDTYPQAPANWS